jgi:hypothetical protein
MILSLHQPLFVRIPQKVFQRRDITLETFCSADNSHEADESKFRRPLVLGNLTVTRYVLRKEEVDTAQWIVSSEDGKLVLVPFASFEEAIEAALKFKNQE